MKKKAIKFASNIDTDQILGAQYLTLPSLRDMARYTLENYPQFVDNFTPGDIIVGEDNFGCGSSREQSPAVLKQRGVSAIVARSFARIFYRNYINLGIPVIECRETAHIGNLDIIEINIEAGRITNITTGETYRIEPYPAFVRDIINDGGIIKHLQRLKKIDATAAL